MYYVSAKFRSFNALRCLSLLSLKLSRENSGGPPPPSETRVVGGAKERFADPVHPAPLCGGIGCFFIQTSTYPPSASASSWFMFDNGFFFRSESKRSKAPQNRAPRCYCYCYRRCRLFSTTWRSLPAGPGCVMPSHGTRLGKLSPPSAACTWRVFFFMSVLLVYPNLRSQGDCRCIHTAPRHEIRVFLCCFCSVVS